MTRMQRFCFLAVMVCSLAVAHAQTVEVVNHQPFPIAMPWRLHDGNTVMVDVAASGRQTIDLALREPAAAGMRVEPVENGIGLNFDGRDLGALSWDILVQKLDKKPDDAEAAKTKRDFMPLFHALPMKFSKSGNGALFETWSAEGSKDGLKIAVSLDVYSRGFIDLHATITNESAPTTLVYAALLTGWQQPPAASRSVNYDNHITSLNDGSSTLFRAGEGRHLFIQRGVDWINTNFDNASVAWLNDFAPSFTVHHDKRPKTPARWVGGNMAPLGQEAMLSGNTLLCVTELARPNLKSFQGRFDDNVLPDKDQPMRTTSRLIFSSDKLSDERVDQLFVAYTGFNPQSKTGDKTTLTFGVSHVKFGTAYFPYSTLGENFEKWHMPGQEKTTYWTLSADTVTNYKLFADDIKRDLRILKSMGFQSVRLHHLEMLDQLDRKVQDEYLDFFFGELKHLGLTALLDVKLPPQRVAELVKRYRPQVDGVEIDNEVLIFGINDEDVPVWKQTYAAVKKVAPDLPVHLTAHTNTSAFERLLKLGVPFDKLGLHAYMDSVDAIPSSRDYALACANEASEIGKEPCITEWNWRFLTRMTPEDRAKVYPPIFENVLKTRCMPLIYQFQFQDSLAMASRTLRGIRHYELLNLSRRPRPEAFEFVNLIHEYGDPSAPQEVLQTKYQTVDHTQTAVAIAVTNASEKKLSVTATPEAPFTMQVSKKTFDIEPKQTVTIELKPQLPADALSGFHHVFVRFDAGDNLVSYAWIEIRKPGGIVLDENSNAFPNVVYGQGALDFNFNRDLAVVYGEKASGWEVESAWLLYQTLESATGRPVKIFQLSDLPPEVLQHGNLIAVGTPNSNPLVGDGTGAWVKQLDGRILMIGGEDEARMNEAAIDVVLRYWKQAKDSGARRIPLTDKPIQKGADPNALP